jgi:hypothetical protein
MLVEDMPRNNFSHIFEQLMFNVLYPFVTYLTTLSHMSRLICTPLRPQNVFTAILLSGLLSPLAYVTEMGPR